MPEQEEREFRLALTIKDKLSDDAQSGAHAVLALFDDAENPGHPLLVVEAGGFTPDEAGAGMLADMLRDAARAIDSHLNPERAHVHTESLPTVKRPRFNPRPRGAQQ